MQYMGSKRRIAKDILPIMLEDRSPDQWWIEPFVGGGNMIENVQGPRIGFDANKHAINALIMIRDYVEDLPKNNAEFTEEDYRKSRQTDRLLSSFVGFAYSFGGKFWGGWSRDKRGRDYVSGAFRNAQKQSPKLQGVLLGHASYDSLVGFPKNCLIYCDPPYQGTSKYKDPINHDLFWQWCREKTLEGHRVFVSEYQAPRDFTLLWEKTILSGLVRKDPTKKPAEKLFTYEAPE